MVDSINLYISAADDLLIERDLLSRIVTEIPVTLGWQINFSPIGRKTLVEKFIVDAHLHILILGSDIRAPVGFELHLSRILHRSPFLLLKKGTTRTPAAIDFHRSISNYAKWQTFDELSELRYLALGNISQNILDQAQFFSLGSDEYDRLSAFLKNLDESKGEELEIVKGGTGENSVILTRERFTPRDGVLIQPPVESDQDNLEE